MQATLDLDVRGKRILAQIPYANGQGKVWAKRIPGHLPVWDKTGPRDVFIGWSYPLAIETCRKFREVFRSELRISNRLAEWARIEIARQDKLEELRSGTAIELDKVQAMCPDLYVALATRRYQIAGAGFIHTGRQVLLGDDPGLGKTLQALAAIVQSGSQDILVVCPKTATYNVWVRETAFWTPHIMTFRAQGTHAEREKAFQDFAIASAKLQPKMLIVNTEMVRAKRIEVCSWSVPACRGRNPEDAPEHRHTTRGKPDWPQLFDLEWDAIILDESHNLLASTANVQSKRITQGRYGAMLLRRCLRSDGIALALSGTPFRSKLERSWGTLNWLRPDVFGSFWRFAEAYFEVGSDGWGKVIGTKNEEGKQVAVPIDSVAFDRAMRPYYLKRTKSEAAPDLPPITYAGTPPPANKAGLNGIWLEMEGLQERMYSNMLKNAGTDIIGGRILANGVLAEITRLRQFACSAGAASPDLKMTPAMPSNKIEWLLQFLREGEGNTNKTVVASSFTGLIELTARTIRRELGLEVLTLTGATSDKDRATLVRRFNDPDDKLRVVIINSYAGGEAITLDRCCDDLIFLDLPWTSDQAEQVESRIHRVSRIHPVTVYRLMSANTVDEWMAALTEEQRQVLFAARPKDLKELILEALS